jgi:colicin import membrane protein
LAFFLSQFLQANKPKIEVYSISVVPGHSLGGVGQIPTRPDLLKGQKPQRSVVEEPESLNQQKEQLPDDKAEQKLAVTKRVVTPKPIPSKADEKLKSVTGDLSPTSSPTKVLSTSTPTPTSTVARATKEKTKEPGITPQPTATLVAAKPTVVPTVRATQTAKATVGQAAPTKSPATLAPTPKAEPTAGKNQPAKPQQKGTADKADEEYRKSVDQYLGESVNAGGKGFGAARTGGSGTGGGTQRPPEFFRYFDQIQKIIKSNWRWYDSNANLRVEVEMKLAKNGAIEFARIVESSAVPEFDRSVMRALEASDPLPPPPAIVYNYFKHVIIVFDPRE